MSFALNAEAVPVEAFLGAESLSLPGAWYLLPFGSENSIPIPLGGLPLLVQSIWDLLSGGGGSDQPKKPYQLDSRRHPIYPWLGIVWDLILTQASKAKGSAPNRPPLQRVEDNGPTNGNVDSRPFQQQDQKCTAGGGYTERLMNFFPGVLACCKQHDNCYTTYGCNASSWRRYYPPFGPCNTTCNAAAVGCIAGSWNAM